MSEEKYYSFTMIALLAKIVAALNTNSKPAEIAAGFAYRVMLALIPAGNLLWILLFVLFSFSDSMSGR